MPDRKTITVRVSELVSALELVVKLKRKKRGKKPTVGVSLEFNGRKKELIVSEAEYSSNAHSINAQGRWPARVQVEGIILRRVLEKYPGRSDVEMEAGPLNLVISFGSSRLELPRLDPHGKGGIDTMPLPKNPKHNGPVVAPPDPTTKRVELADNWNFSARVPMPQHREPKKS